MNVCLLPEVLSRINNLSDASRRASAIGARVVIDQFHYENMTSAHQETNEKSVSKTKAPGYNPAFIQGIVTHFPKLDFICLQETWSRALTRPLIKELHKVFPWILHSVGATSYNSNRFLLNSGLMFASRYRILDADFRWFKHSCNQCVYSSKGLLMVKVLVSEKDKTYVGYIYNTHLQAYQGVNNVLEKQLDCMLQWTREFREQTLDLGDVILFDVVCGDFNFDNMSPGEAGLRDHALFSEYEDVGRVRPGLDQKWTVGKIVYHSSTTLYYFHQRKIWYLS
ncbi:hypothetical protein ScPMuIL_006204 [Solemya velum]